MLLPVAGRTSDAADPRNCLRRSRTTRATSCSSSSCSPSSLPPHFDPVSTHERKRKRDEVEAGYERSRLGVATAEKEPAPLPRPVVGRKRKAPDDVAVAAAGGAGEDEEGEAFDDEAKLLRTVFVGNLPLRSKKKALAKEFAAFGEIESVRIRFVPLSDTKVPRKGAVIKGKLNDKGDNVHAYIVFKDEQCARAALSHNMALEEKDLCMTERGQCLLVTFHLM